jgi:hypothetical protein
MTSFRKLSARALLIAVFATPTAALAERPSVIDSTRATRAQLQYSFSRGQTSSYTLQFTQQIEPLSGQPDENNFLITVSLPFNQEVQNVSDSGVSSIATTLGELALDVQTESRTNFDPVRERLRGVRITSRVDRDGTLVEQINPLAIGLPAFDPAALVADIFLSSQPALPREAVGIGDSWIQTIPMSLTTVDLSISGDISVRYTLVGYAFYGGREVAVLDGVYETSVSGVESMEGLTSATVVGRGNGEGYVLFSVGEGRVLEHGMRNGVVLTTTDATGSRSVVGIQFQASVSLGGLPQDAEGSAAVVAP